MAKYAVIYREAGESSPKRVVLKGDGEAVYVHLLRAYVTQGSETGRHLRPDGELVVYELVYLGFH